MHFSMATRAGTEGVFPLGLCVPSRCGGPAAVACLCASPLPGCGVALAQGSEWGSFPADYGTDAT